MKQTKSCSQCGETFSPYHSNAKICNRAECKKAASKERWEAWRERRRADGTFREIENARQQKYRTNSSYSKNWELKSKYGITLADWYDMLDAAGGKCEICSKDTDLCVDHDHVTGKVRGVLCRGCNRSVGQLGDTLEHLRKAVAYFERTTDLG